MNKVFEKIIEKLEEKEKYIKELMQELCFSVREAHGDTDVCGLCEYDGAYMTESGDWANECPGFESNECFKLSNEISEKLSISNIVKQVAEEYNNGWIPCSEPPKDDRYVLLSFDNFSVPMVGRYEEDENGGSYYIGDDMEPCVTQDIFVNAWKPLPHPYHPKGE